MSENPQIKKLEKTIADLEKKIDDIKNPKKKTEQIDESEKSLKKEKETQIKKLEKK